MKGVKFFLIFLFFLIGSKAAVSDESPSVLLLNSDRSVEKYRIVQEEFKKTIKYPIKEIYINDLTGHFSKTKKIFKSDKYDLIFCIGTKAYMTAYQNARETDIVFSSILNWQRLPQKPGVFGISNEPHIALEIMLFRYIFPNISKLGVLYSDKFNHQWFESAKAEAKTFGVQLIGQKIQDTSLKKSKLVNLTNNIDALWLIPDPMIISGKKNLIDIMKRCDRNKVPIFSYNTVFIKYGAVLIITADDATIGRQAAGIAQDVLTGTESTPKVQFPAGSQVILNLKKVKKYKLIYREEALGTINRIIE